ncbi:MAG TPA: hypothetical protein VFF73_36675 [Planctomycetota bacterium]|nr:hypothetical protein [Planctomycetota bacterium]
MKGIDGAPAPNNVFVNPRRTPVDRIVPLHDLTDAPVRGEVPAENLTSAPRSPRVRLASSKNAVMKATNAFLKPTNAFSSPTNAPESRLVAR